MKVTVQTNASDEARRLQRMADSFSSTAAAEVYATAQDALPATRQGTPVDTGELQSSWQTKPTRKGATTTNTARHAEYVGDLESVADDAYTDALKRRPPFNPEPKGAL